MTSTVIRDDHDLITGTEEGIAHVLRRLEAQTNAVALRVALDIANQEMLLQMTRNGMLQSALLQEQAKNERLERELLGEAG